MKKLTFTILAMIICQSAFAQISGNINYQSQVKYSDNNISISLPLGSDIYISVKGLANVKADTYVAIFSTTQVGKTSEEVNTLIDERITKSTNAIKTKKDVVVFVDMISFVPVFEFEVEKKVFSKKSYNEVPKGFELKKNIHIKFSDPNQLNDFITILSQNEIYDLVRVDYFSSNLESIKKELANKAKLIIQEKIKNYETLLGETFTNADKQVADGYKVVLPVEMYKSYEAFNSTSLNLKKTANVNQVEKTTTLYYQPIVDKEFDFVLNPTILEPVIQVMYELKMSIKREAKKPVQVAQPAQNTKEYFFITPNGDIKNMNLK